MSSLILLFAIFMALLQVICAELSPQHHKQSLPYAPSPPAGYHGPGAAYGGHPPMPYKPQMPGAPNQAHFPQGHQQPLSLRASIMDRLHSAKNKPIFTKTLNSMKPLVGNAARFAAPAINKATGWTKHHEHHGHHNNMMQPAPYGANSYPEANFKPQVFGGISPASHGLNRGGPTRY